MDNKQKHLEMIQGVINRLAANSFSIKGWSIVIVSALFALSASNSQIAYTGFAIVPVALFWGLDGYFLWQERLFRKLYDKVRVLPNDEINFSMDTSVIKGKERPKQICVTFSGTLASFYGTLISLVLIMVSLICYAGDKQ